MSGGISKVTAIGRQPVSVALIYSHNATRPDDTAADQMRMVLTLLYPVKK